MQWCARFSDWQICESEVYNLLFLLVFCFCRCILICILDNALLYVVLFLFLPTGMPEDLDGVISLSAGEATSKASIAEKTNEVSSGDVKIKKNDIARVRYGSAYDAEGSSDDDEYFP